MANYVSVRDAALQYHPFSGQVSVYLFGQPLDWNISGDEQEAVRERISTLLDELNIANTAHVYAPKPTEFNAKVCTTEDLKEEMVLRANVILNRGCNADGVILPAHSAFWLSSADCITIIVHDSESGETIAAHGGRDCLLDRGRINGGPAREHESVVHAMVERFSRKQIKGLRVFITCGIGPENFSHSCGDEKYGTVNTRMVMDILHKWGLTCLYGNPFEGKISLPEIVRAQLIDLGVAPHNIGYDGVETFHDLQSTGSHRWWSHRRGDGKKRNGVLVVRNW